MYRATNVHRCQCYLYRAANYCRKWNCSRFTGDLSYEYDKTCGFSVSIDLCARAIYKQKRSVQLHTFSQLDVGDLKWAQPFSGI